MAQATTGTGTLVGYFENNSDARQAVEALQDAGFSSAQLGVAHRGGSSTSSDYPSNTEESEPSTDSSTPHQSASKTAAHAREGAIGTWEKVKNFLSGGSAEPYADERTQGDLANREITQN